MPNFDGKGPAGSGKRDGSGKGQGGRGKGRGQGGQGQGRGKGGSGQGKGGRKGSC